MDLVAARYDLLRNYHFLILLLDRTIEEKLLWCFKLYDTDNSGVIDRDEMGNIMEVRFDSREEANTGPQCSRSTACWRPSMRGPRTIQRREQRRSSLRLMSITTEN